MKNYETGKIRNICLLGHGRAGKTTLAEAMLFNSGAIDRFGNVADGSTTTDYDPEEIKRKFSISTAIAPVEWKGYKFNIIDTPGYFDFAGGVYEGIRGCDGAIIIVSGRSGVSVGAEKAFKLTKEKNIPTVMFVNKLDDERANYQKTLEEMKEKFGKSIAPFVVPIKEGDKFKGFVDVVEKKAQRFDGQKAVDVPVPDDMADQIDPVRDMILEAVAETSEELMDKYFNGEEFTVDEIKTALKFGIDDRSIIPVFCGSLTNNIGVLSLLDALYKYMPAPDELGTVMAQDAKTKDLIELKPDEKETLSAVVFKTVVDPYVGKLSIFKVCSGTMTADSILYNSKTEQQERIGHLFYICGKKQIETDKIVAGDIGAVTKLASTNTGDTLCTQAKPVILDGIEYPKPVMSLAAIPKAKGDEEKISSGLHKLMEEDPTFVVENNTETHQLIISGLGEQHLDVIISKLKSKFGVSVDLSEPMVPYRETIKKKVKVEGKHKKQSGGHGQYGHVWIEFEPGETEDLTFEEKIFGGAVPKNYFPAVEKGLRDAIEHGVLAGYPVVNLKATLVDGSYHPVDSSEMAFKLAATLAYKKGLAEASPALLEPIGHLEVIVPDAVMGDIIGDINKRRGRMLGMNPLEDGLQQVVAEVPMAEMHRYATDLRSMTQGRGSFTFSFERYEEAIPAVAQKVIEDAKSRANGIE